MINLRTIMHNVVISFSIIVHAAKIVFKLIILHDKVLVKNTNFTFLLPKNLAFKINQNYCSKYKKNRST